MCSKQYHLELAADVQAVIKSCHYDLLSSDSYNHRPSGPEQGHHRTTENSTASLRCTCICLSGLYLVCVWPLTLYLILPKLQNHQ